MTPLHGIASRSDLPLPFEAVLAGAGAVLLITFWILFFAWRRPRYGDDDGTPMPRLTRFVDSRPVTLGLRLVVAAVWLLAAIALVFGADRIDNPSVGFIYVWLWVGLVVASVLFGGVYAFTNPVRSLLARRGATRVAVDVRGSRLPGAVALLGFLFLELVVPGGVTLPVLRAAAALWLVWTLAGALRSTAWIARAEPFEVYASTVARLSPWRRRGGVIHRLSPLRNLASWAPPTGTWAVAVVLLGGTAFDALSNSAAWVRATQGSGVPPWLLGSAGLLLAVGLVWGLYALGCGALRGGPALRETMDRYSPGLVPLVVGYCLAHYGTMFYLEGQRTAIWFNDPLGLGHNLFGFVEAAPDVTLFAYPSVVAWAQVLLIVGGHVLGVLVTHDIALRDGHGGAARRQLPLLAVMIGFTVGGLLLMFGG